MKETIRAEWTGAAPHWQKWNEKLIAQSQAATDLVVRNAQLAPGMHVLDLASGTGEPSLSIARAVGPQGRVVATDLVPGMLENVRQNARALGLTNMEFRQADAEQLPFSDQEFDRVTCRFGIMFFPQIDKALANVRRVLKPGGRVSFIVWGSFADNPLFAATLGPFMKHVQVPPPPPDAPTIFRFADESKLASTLKSAGLHSVEARKHQVPWPWPGPPEEAWEALRDLAAPFRKMIDALPPEKQPEVMEEVMSNIRSFHDGDRVNLPATLVTGTGVA
ncbi:MAG TPA: class I SAM-dependent methyltransferase [Terriglobales bacterium]|nr:class I SAM-dependent methyltransferase [Terriglobales bacterium]